MGSRCFCKTTALSVHIPLQKDLSSRRGYLYKVAFSTNMSFSNLGYLGRGKAGVNLKSSLK